MTDFIFIPSEIPNLFDSMIDFGPRSYHEGSSDGLPEPSYEANMAPSKLGIFEMREIVMICLGFSSEHTRSRLEAAASELLLDAWRMGGLDFFKYAPEDLESIHLVTSGELTEIYDYTSVTTGIESLLLSGNFYFCERDDLERWLLELAAKEPNATKKGKSGAPRKQEKSHRASCPLVWKRLAQCFQQYNFRKIQR